ncbi:MAG TPA: hypothetical protein VKF62_14095 [Planctomycetota bacterium]|nr:hypothetical protein [Planctomycetota bacterium]
MKQPWIWLVSGAALFGLPASAFAQPCPVPCNGVQVVCHHQNGIRNNTGLVAPNPANVAPIAGPNAANPGGNVPGDAEWKVWGCENGMTRGSGVHTLAGWEVGLFNSLPGAGTLAYTLPNLELRPVVPGPTGVRVPDLAAAPSYAAGLGALSLPVGTFRVNVSINTPTVATPAACPSTAALPTLSNADVSMLFLYPPGQVLGAPGYTFQLQTQNETTVLANGGNSYSGTINAATGAVPSYAPAQELFGELAFFEPTLEVLRLTAGFLAPSTGAGARDLAAGDSVVLRSEDWQGAVAAIAGQDRLAAFLFSDTSMGSPLCPAGPGAALLPGSLFLPGSTGSVALFPTPLTASLLSYSTGPGQGLLCHFPGDVFCGASGLPSVFTDMRAETAPILVPPGLSGSVLYAAALYLNLTTLTIEDGSNTVELLFL